MANKIKKHPAKKRGGSHFDHWLIAGILISLVLIMAVLWRPLHKFHPLEEKKQTQKVRQQEMAPFAKKSPEKPSVPQPKREPLKHKPVPVLLGSASPSKTVQIAIVIDDLGMDVKQARNILSLPAKITFSVMPGLAQSKNVAELAEQNSHEVLIHVPMEYRGKNGKPAPGILRSNMTPMEFMNTVSSDVESVPGAVGINNHEGSALTENKEAMKFLMADLKARNLMFLDSLTSAKSVAYATAKEFGLRSGKRDVFLDNDFDNPASIRKQLDELVEIARKNGKAIGIGHPHPDTIIELRKWLSDAGNQGFEIVPVSRLMQ